jgi:hypothetical protein
VLCVVEEKKKRREDDGRVLFLWKLSARSQRAPSRILFIYIYTFSSFFSFLFGYFLFCFSLTFYIISCRYSEKDFNENFCYFSKNEFPTSFLFYFILFVRVLLVDLFTNGLAAVIERHFDHLAYLT